MVPRGARVTAENFLCFRENQPIFSAVMRNRENAP
jgi:hypothetical protein